jgi:hypothetical protein
MSTGHFQSHYISWRESRINKIISILGKDFFNNKTILELAAGHGDTGRYFRSLGSTVTFAEGNELYLPKIKELNPDSYILRVDQDKEWNLGQKFDIVIHWGVLYHLNNWQRDLQTAISHGKIIFLESEVCNSDDPYFEIKTNENGYDQAVNGIGSRPSAGMIERCIVEAGASYTRYNDSDINAGFHRYDWPVTNTRTWEPGLRRFWIIKR